MRFYHYLLMLTVLEIICYMAFKCVNPEEKYGNSISILFWVFYGIYCFCKIIKG